MPEPDEIYAACRAVVGESEVLAGRHVVISAGGTREPLDPVRYLGNRSSGKQGYALAAAAVAMGAQVTLVSSAALPTPHGVSLRQVETALEMRDVMVRLAQEADLVIMAAAVADFRPAEYAEHKIKKSHGGAADQSAPTIGLVRNPDILAELVQARGEASQPVIVGFAAETGDDHGSVLDHGRAKLARKGCDLLVVNEVGPDKTFGQDDNTVQILRRDRADVVQVGPASKRVVAEAILAQAADRLA